MKKLKEYLTFGPRQKLPTDIKELLKISEFKKELLKFLKSEYQDPIYARILGEKIFYCSIDNECKRYSVVDGVVKVDDIPELYGNHLEADTRVAFHALHADKTDGGNIVVRGNLVRTLH